MSNATARTLATANRHLRAGLARLLPEPSPSAPLHPKDFSDLLMELLHAGACLRSIPLGRAPDADLQDALSEYRSLVERLAQILPHVHGRLLTEKARLQLARAHVTATAAWARASQNTL